VIGRHKAPSKGLSKAALERLVEEATVDAYGEAEQVTGLFAMIEEDLKLPFVTKILGMDVTVEKVDLSRSNDVNVICRRGSERQSIPILDLPLPSPQPSGWEWVEAYRHWVGG